MRIAVFASTFPQLSETSVSGSVASLIDRGHDVVVYANQIGGPEQVHEEFLPYDLRGRTRVRRVTDGRSHGGQRGRRIAARLLRRHDPRLLVRAMNPLRFGRRALTLDIVDRAEFMAAQPAPDIVHAHFGPNGVDAAMLRELNVLSAPLVTTLHGEDLRALESKSLAGMAHLVRGCNEAHTACTWGAHTLVAAGFPSERTRIMPVGIDLARYGPRDHPPGAKRGEVDEVVITTIASLIPEKAIEVGIGALAALMRHPAVNTPRLRWRIIGDGPLRASLEQLAVTQRLGGVVEFLGARHQRFVAEVLRTTDLFLLPSRLESMPISIIEAMAAGCPVIASDVGSIRELVQDGVTGRLVPPDDTGVLALALDDLLRDRSPWPALGEAGRRLVEQRHDRTQTCLALEARYEALIAQG